jgi:NTE family protein
MTRLIRLLLVTLIVAIQGCSAHFPINAALATDSVSTPYYLHKKYNPARSDELLVILAFSGGGMRASALSYGVLKALDEIPINLQDNPQSLLDEVDLISSVSGGSFTAAYFGLFGKKILQDYEHDFLKYNIEGALLLRLLNPKYWFRLGSLYYDRSELAADYYDDHLFHGATFSDLANAPGPAVLINATDLTLGSGFGFHQEQFDWMCSSVSDFPVSRAVATSSAVPGLFSAVTLYNYGGHCGDTTPQWMQSDIWSNHPQLAPLADKIKAYTDGDKRPYVHLIDGGLADNLGLRAIMEQVALHGGAHQALDHFGLRKTRNILIITVNAAASPNQDINQQKNPPSALFSVDAATTVQINLYNRETVSRFKTAVKQWQDEISLARCGRPWCTDGAEMYFVNISLDQIADKSERNELQQLPTTFYLENEAVDKLIQAGSTLLNTSPDFSRFIKAIGQ